MTQTAMKVLEIRGRRWFQTSYGNTYFSCVISVDGEEIHGIEFEYGHDQMYEQWAREWLVGSGYLPEFKVGDSLSMYCREKNIILISNAVDVSRKKDL